MLQRAVLMVLEPIYRAGLSGLLVRFPAGAECPPGAGGAVAGADGDGRWLDHRPRHPELLSTTLIGITFGTFWTERVRDGVIRRAIGKWLNAGVMESGEVSHPDTGDASGRCGFARCSVTSICTKCSTSGLSTRSSRGCGGGRLRSVSPTTRRLVFEREEDARRVLAVLSKRFARSTGCACIRRRPAWWTFAVRRVPGRTARRRERSFALLGFTHFWGRSRKGRWVVQRKTAKDRFTRALREIGRWCRAHRHWPVAAQQAALSRKLRGHYAYYGITGNGRALARFALRSPVPVAQVA